MKYILTLYSPGASFTLYSVSDAADWIYNICGVAGYLVDTFQIALSIVDRFVDLYESPINRHR